MKFFQWLAAPLRALLVRLMALVLRFPGFSGWLIERLRRFPWLFNALAAMVRPGGAGLPAKPLIVPDRTPATRQVLEALDAEFARTDRTSG